MVFIEAPSEAQEQLALPQVMKDQCDYWGISPTGVSIASLFFVVASC